MKREIRNLWVQALEGSSSAYRKLGIRFYRGYGKMHDRRLAELCLREAVRMGDQKAFFLYHRFFSQGKQVIDDVSYEEIYREYRNTKDRKRKKLLYQYLLLGTKRQKEDVRKAFHDD